MTREIALMFLLLAACASPLLTWLHLWQVKEWRWDRLSEHFRQEGFAQLYGKIRLLVVLLWVPLAVFIPIQERVLPILGALSLLSIIQMTLLNIYC